MGIIDSDYYGSDNEGHIQIKLTNDSREGKRLEVKEGTFKYRLQLNNTVGIIDSDYYGSDNEGHIQIKLTNDSREGKRLEVKEGTGFAQGIFLEYGITVDDETTEERNGGFGSTTR